MNRFIDTRGNVVEPFGFRKAIVTGIAPGGGLFVPVDVPRIDLDQIVGLAAMPYAEQAALIYKLFDIDVPAETIDVLMGRAYGANFDTPAIAPVVRLHDDTYILELFHGPTSAFKDMALQCLPHFFTEATAAMRQAGELDHDHLILVATSGDTGKAALQGFAGLDHIAIVVYYPDGGVSDIQLKQMTTQEGDNVCVFAARGDFDDCQTSVKKTFADRAFCEELAEKGLALSSANSINWGRLMPQIVYYVSAYSQMVAQGAIKAGAAIDVCVPTGNFGDILAAYYAKRMGTPIGRLVCASNTNNVLTDFIKTGTYDIRERSLVLTPSPSMDILVSSNLERQLFELTDRDPGAIREWMADLAKEHCFSIDVTTLERLQELYAADCVDNQECLATIGRVFDDYGYLADPHTAVAIRVAEKHKGANPMLVASTAHWAKFGANVWRALEGMDAASELPADVAAMTGVELNRAIAERTGAYVPAGLAELDSKPRRFDTVVDATPDGVQASVMEWLQGR